MRELLRGGGLVLATWLAGSGRSHADDAANQLNLADLAAYRAALSGKPTADGARASDPPASATFRDLWDKADAFKGRRVSVRGRIERIFRQGPVGRFPALVQAWAYSPAGDPFCLVYPDSSREPDLGEETRFIGTFLKIVEYPASDGPRLAPMIVGDSPPAPLERGSAAPRSADRSPSPGVPAGSSRSQIDRIVGLVAALAVAGLLAVRHLRSGVPPRRGPVESDPPLEFIPTESVQETGGTS